eukprot:TRINITY_DN999_c0_g1_i1.p1 TRINITY_DN999_c0_g1~~TRINITY_DN999_c0_g1_i1.p1  ORF type:complete len:484 (-),score=142.45 TRINITY_DN999_c0_g1_i1:700-2151(-)
MAEASSAGKIQEYLDDNKLQPTLQVIINDLCKQMPKDAYGFLVNQLMAKCAAPQIEKLVGREVLDSRANPTVETDVYCTFRGQSKLLGRAAAPSGASTGSNEAYEMRDGDNDRYLGKGVKKAVDNVNVLLSNAVKGANPTDLAAIDDLLCKADGTELKQTAGGNAVTATSFAVAEAGAALLEIPLYRHLANVFYRGREQPKKFSLPTPMVNILNGGKHAGGNLKIQEFMIMPAADIPFTEKLRIVTQVYHHLGRLLAGKYGLSAKNLGDEGGYAPPLDTAEDALNMIEQAISAAGFIAGKDVFMALDCAASEFYKDGKYEIAPKKLLTGDELLVFYEKLVADHPALKSIEDGFDEKDYEMWKKFTERLGDKIMIVGDDLFTTNTNLLQKGVAEKWANALLLKVNQIGTISEAMNAARMMYEAKGNVAVSHRSGETTGSLIADLVVAIGARYIKTGAPARGERVAKYNRLLQIEEDLTRDGLLA